MKTVVRLLFLLLAFTGYFFVAMFIMAYYYSESHYRLDAAYKQNSMLKPYLKGAEDTISFGIVSDPLEFDNELIKTLESFPLIFEQICKSKKNLETLKISFKNCQNFVPCQLHSDFRVFKTLLSKNRSNMLDEIQDFFETHFDAKTSFIRSSLSISDYNFALKLSRKERASYLFSRIFKKYRIISSQNTQNKTLTATILEEIHEEFFDFISDYSSCRDDFRKRVKMSEPERNHHMNMTENFSLKALVGLSDVFSYNWTKSIEYWQTDN